MMKDIEEIFYQEVKEPVEELKEKVSEMQSLEELNNVLLRKEREANDELQAARKAAVEEVIDENDDKLRELRDEYGDEVFKDVETAMLQLNEYNPSGKYHVPILWSFKEVTQATLEESSQAAVNQLIPPSRDPRSAKYRKLIKELCEVIEDYGLVNFTALDIQQSSKETMRWWLKYLIYGEQAAMEVLIQHFEPHLQNWGKFDRLQKEHQDNPKDKSLAEKTAAQSLL
ncbi:hypothetical protein AMTR_s00010p00167310 [Amborella trichopoda]|uniref:Uncharacterized protein n=1 Tax=Amborella trichopoda TaxID=13333 RepID=W1NG66_AMBTC|nr:hypothetical protein AMTR_s00010p00167310 [Amborella trichopoda]